MSKEEDVITYSFGRKIQIRQYEPIDFSCSYQTKVKAGETPAKALERAVKFVEDFIEEKSDEFTRTK